LKASPTAAIAIPIRISGSPSRPLWAIPAAIPSNPVEPVPP
jgi:hypothetical protein